MAQSPISPAIKNQIDRLAELEGSYLRAKRAIEDGTYDKRQAEIVQKIRSVMPLATQLNRDVGLMTIGRIMQLLDDNEGEARVIQEYESVKKSLAIAFPDEK